MAKKKITRGISEDFAEAFKKSQLYRLYEKHKDELLIGIRNDYLNLYYNCDSIAKIEHKKPRGIKNKKIFCVIDKYYIDGKHYNQKDKEKRFKIDQNQICDDYEKIKQHSNDKSTPEKKAQSNLILLNNGNKASNWFCIDVEYVKSFYNQQEKDEAKLNARFDIIALSKKEPHKVALIELKYGSKAISGQSGIYKHVQDYVRFCDKDFFEGHLKQEIIEIIKSQKDLGLSVPFELPKEENLLPPEFYFITLNNNAEKENASTPKQTMAGYLFKKPRWDCKRLSTKYCVENDFGDITKKNNKFHATFLFSSATIEDLERRIVDIIDGDYDERIVPE